MQTAAKTYCLLTGCSSKAGFADSGSTVGDRLLHHLVASHLIQTVGSQELFVKLTKSLLQFAEQTYLTRDLDTLLEVSRVLMNLPADSSRQIGLYYYALAINRKGQKNEAEELLVRVADRAPITYRARAIQTLGANYHDDGRFQEALSFQHEALRMASDKNAQCLQTMLKAHFKIAIVRSIVGDHNGALSHLGRLSPLVHLIARKTSVLPLPLSQRAGG